MSECKHGRGDCAGIKNCACAFADCFQRENPVPVQIAEELASLSPGAEALIIAMGNYGGASLLRPCADKLAERIKYYGSAQRQAGREEVLKEVDEEVAEHLAELDKRYATLVELIKEAKKYIYTTCDIKDRIDKALSDLGSHKEETK